MNIHTPERFPDETKAQYRARQALSRFQTKLLTQPTKVAPAAKKEDFSQFTVTQHINADRARPRHSGARRVALAASQVTRQVKERNRKKALQTGLRDEHGAYTLTGSNQTPGSRRMWLAGISAQRGY